MTDLIKALRERREELRNELQENPSFQEYELVCRLLERREASVSTPRLFDRRLRNVSQRPNVSQLRSNSRSTDRPHSHGLTGG